MQHLTGVELVEQAGQLGICETHRIGNLGEIGRDMIAGSIDLVAPDGERRDLAEEGRVETCAHTQCLQVAGARGLEVYQSARVSSGDPVDAEFVRAGMQAELVGSQRPGNRCVPGEIALEFRQIPDVVHPLLEPADVARRQADPTHAQSAQFSHDKHVFSMRRGGGRFIDGDLELETPVALGAALARGIQVPVHHRHVRHCPAILDRSPNQRLLIEHQRAIFQIDTLAHIGRAQICSGGSQAHSLTCHRSEPG